jgi:stage II sporulation protein E
MIPAYLLTTLISTLIIGENELISVMFFEAVIGSGLFLLLPKSLVGYLGGLLSPTTEISKLDSVKASLIMRLEFASGALRDVYETVEDVAEKLGKINCPDFDKTLNKVEGEVCGGCSLRRHCWETAKEITATDALSTWNRIKNQKGADKNEKSEFNCLRKTKFEDSIKKHCAEYETKKSAELRLKEVRNVINDQFDGISKMLSDLSEEFKYDVCHDGKAAENIILSLKNLGYHAINCIAAKDKFGRISADIHIKGAADLPLNKMTILKNLSLAVGRDFDKPMVSVSGDEAFIFITERPNFKVEIGLSQIPEEQGKLCGDNAKYFSDGRGRLVMLISDGMGTGGRAAVDSAMVSGLFSRMLRSGFGYDCSLKIINSSMLFKSTDESLATVDIAAIDLFSGECELLKAGAAPTFVKRSTRVGKAQSNSLPPGILRNITFDKANVNLKAEDIVVMVSDGAITEGTEWISNIINDWTIGSAQQLADEIAFAAKRRRNDGHNDDITVLVGILKKR